MVTLWWNQGKDGYNEAYYTYKKVTEHFGTNTLWQQNTSELHRVRKKCHYIFASNFAKC